MTDFFNLPGVSAEELPAIREGILRLAEASEPEEIVCPACINCCMFTIVNIKDASDKQQAGSWAMCMECGHLVEIRIVGRHALCESAEVPCGR
jgi:hypothetical protein